jgi:hypothetical protein
LNTKSWIKIASVVALSGFILVIGTLLTNLFIGITPSFSTTVMVIGFTLMFLGTLWKVVLEMNSPD